MLDFSGQNVLVMGYGLHKGGSGPQAALYMAQHGAKLTVTDLRSAEILAPNMALLKDYDVHWVLGEHRQEDFDTADIVVKNPGVHKNSPFLKQVKRIETDLSLFLAERQPAIIAVTGSKGKSTTSALIHHVLSQKSRPCHLCGNITVSPLMYLNKITNTDVVVLELSSWQSGDLSGRGLLHPAVSVITNLFADHQNYYHNMQDYAQDKAAVLLEQDSNDWAVLNLDDAWTPFFAQKARGKIAYFSNTPLAPQYATEAYWQKGCIVLRKEGMERAIAVNLPAHILPQNAHAAALALFLFGVEPEEIAAHLSTFPGLPYRLAHVATKREVAYYNDSAATIPAASVASIKQLAKMGKKLHVIFGGADKELDFSPLLQVLPLVAHWYVFKGTAFEKIDQVMQQARQAYEGPFADMASVMARVTALVQPGDIVLLSPGCASFGIFINEFDRGDKFCQAVQTLAD